MKKHHRSIKAVLSFLVCLLFALSSFTVFAQEIPQVVSSEITQLSDGYYTKTEIRVGMTRSSSRSVIKSIAVYDSKDVELCELVVQGIFSYNGSTVTCTSSDAWGQVYASGWSVTDISHTHTSGAAKTSTATARGTAKKKVLGITVKNQPLNVDLFCDRNGNCA